MIASQKIGKSFMGALRYNWKKLFHPDPGKRAELLSTNFTSMDLAFIKAEVDIVRSMRPSLGRYVYHTSLNFSDEDKLDNQAMLAIAQDYLALSGYSNNQYFIFRHHDAGHAHLHLLVNRITFDGEVVSDSNNYKKSEAIAVQLENKYGLVKVSHRAHVAVEQDNTATAQQGIHVSKEQYNYVAMPLDNDVANEPGNRLAAKQYIGVTVKAPTNSELEMIKRTNQPSNKMVLQKKLERLLTVKGITLQDFIRRCEQQGIYLLFNQASTGRVSGVTYFFGDFKVKGQALGNRFKWAELIKKLDYEQVRDSQAISQASERTKRIYDRFQHLATAKAGLGGDSQGDKPHGLPAAEAGGAGYDAGAGTGELAQEPSTGTSLDQGTGYDSDYFDYRSSGYGGIEISDDIDDEAILGRNRRRQQKARTNRR